MIIHESLTSEVLRAHKGFTFLVVRSREHKICVTCGLSVPMTKKDRPGTDVKIQFLFGIVLFCAVTSFNTI